jgi:CheY-like chemotaxis protein
VVTVRSSDDATGTTLEVADNGVGFDASQAYRLFRPLQRLHAADQFDGHGLGLALVKAVADRHQGEVAAGQRPGGGAIFSLWLPRRGDPAPHVTQASQRRVLLVDDDELVLNTLARALERDGHLVTRARDARMALAALGEHPCDILLSDWALPGMDGAALAQQARRMCPAAEIVLMSGRSGLRLELGDDQVRSIDRFVAKPLPLATLRRLVAGELAAEDAA